MTKSSMFTAVALAIVAVTAVAPSGAKARIALNGIALNGIALNGIALKGLALNGAARDGRLSLDFAPGTRRRVPDRLDFRSRNLSGQFVALIGRGLVFSNDRRAAERMFASNVGRQLGRCDTDLWGTADTVDGNGTMRGYFRNVHQNCDIDHGTNGNAWTMSGTDAVMTGTWRFTGGTGKFANITGNGVFNGKQTSPIDFEGTWSRSYNLG